MGLQRLHLQLQSNICTTAIDISDPTRLMSGDLSERWSLWRRVGWVGAKEIMATSRRDELVFKHGYVYIARGCWSHQLWEGCDWVTFNPDPGPMIFRIFVRSITIYWYDSNMICLTIVFYPYFVMCLVLEIIIIFRLLNVAIYLTPSDDIYKISIRNINSVFNDCIWYLNMYPMILAIICLWCSTLHTHIQELYEENS